MKIQIKNRFSGNIIFETDAETLGQAVLAALKRGCNLSGSDLRGCNLRDSDLHDSNLRDCNLSGSDLRDCNLRGSDLRGCNLRDSDLHDSNLRDCNLSGSDLRGCNLRGSDLRDSNLRGCNLRGSDLSDCNLRDCNLSGSDLRGVKNAEFAIAQTRILPDGDLVGWKKCKDGVLVKLLIPANAKRSHAFGRKCRTEFAKVIEVIGAKIGVSSYDSDFIYSVGETVKPGEKFSEDWQDECASGIHFFITKIEAEKCSL